MTLTRIQNWLQTISQLCRSYLNLAAMFFKTAAQILCPVKTLSYHRTYVETWEAINIYGDRRARAKAYISLAILIYYAFANLFYAFLPALETSLIRPLLFDSWFILLPKPSTNVLTFFIGNQLNYFTHFMYFNDSRHMFAIVNDVLLEKEDWSKLGKHFSSRFYCRFGFKLPIVKAIKTWYLGGVNFCQVFFLLTYFIIFDMYRQCIGHMLPHWGQLLRAISLLNLTTFIFELIIFHAQAFVFFFYAFAFCHVVMNVFALVSTKLLILDIKRTQNGQMLARLRKLQEQGQKPTKAATLLGYLREVTQTLLYLIHSNHLYRGLVGVYFLIHMPANAILCMWTLLGMSTSFGAIVSGYVIISYQVVTNIAIHFAMANQAKDIHAPVRQLISIFVSLKKLKNCKSDTSTVRLKVALHIEKMNCPPQNRYGFQYGKTSLITFNTFFKSCLIYVKFLIFSYKLYSKD